MKVSVFITSYNQRAYLKEAVDSVLAQTVAPFEVILIDDASTDGSRDLIESYAARYPALIRVILNEKNLGVPLTKARAVDAARGDWITYVDGDDRWLPRKLEDDARTHARVPAADIVFSDYHFIDADGGRLYPWAGSGARVPEGNVFRETFARDFPRRNLFRCESVRAEAFRTHGNYDERFRMYHDWELRLRLTRHRRAAYSAEPASEYRIHGGGISALPATRHVDEVLALHALHRRCLAGFPRAERRWMTRGMFGWLAPFAVEAARETLNDRAQGLLRRRRRAAAYYALGARHAPDVITLGDLYRLILSAARAGALIDGHAKPAAEKRKDVRS